MMLGGLSGEGEGGLADGSVEARVQGAGSSNAALTLPSTGREDQGVEKKGNEMRHWHVGSFARLDNGVYF